MRIKQLRTALLLLVVLMVISSVMPMTVLATSTTLPSGFLGMSAVDLEVDSGYAWHKMSDEEAIKYGLEADKGTDVYVAGNSDTGTKTVSNLAITVTQPGSLVFDYILETRPGFNAYMLGYKFDTPIVAGGTDNATITPTIAQGFVSTWESFTLSITQEDLGDDGVLIIYIAYLRNGTDTANCGRNFAAIRNVTYTTGNRSNVVQFEGTYDAKMGGVTAELVTVNETTDGAGKTTTTTTYTAADINALNIGSTYRLKATANSGYRFYGWVRYYTYNGKNYSAIYPYEVTGAEITVDANTYYVPIFAAEGTYYIRNGATFYGPETSIDVVLNSAAAGSTVVLVDDYEVPASVTSLTVPAGVTFYVPFREVWGSHEYGTSKTPYHQNGAFSEAISETDKAYVTLTIPSTATMTVKGNLILGAERNAATQGGFQGHIAGRFGHITNDGGIYLEGGSVLTCYGLIDGDGILVAKDGSTLKESLVISDFSGGNNSLQLYNQDQMPFKRYSAQNVQCRLQMEAKSKLTAMAVLFALGGHNEVEVNLLGNGSTVVFLTHETRDHTVILDRTYDGSKQITDGDGNCTVGVGKSTWTVYGGLTFQTLTISLEGVIQLSTARSPFPIPYNMEMNLNNGTYVVNTGLAMLPGSKLTINKGAGLDLSGKLFVYDGLVQSSMSGDKYPTRSDLTEAGFSGIGELILNGSMYVRSGATLGGVIQSTEPGAILTIEENVNLVNSTSNFEILDYTKTKMSSHAETHYDEWVVLGRNNASGITTVQNWFVQDGGAGHYDDNTTWFNIPARIWDGTALKQLEPGTYLSRTGTAEVSDTYVCYYVPEIATGTESGGLTYNTTDGKRYMNDGTETFSRTVNGAWVSATGSVDITSVSVAGSSTSNAMTKGVTLETAIIGNTDGSFHLSITPVKDGAAFTKKLVYLIKCTNADTTVTTAVVADGGWTLPAGTVSITIEAALKGDVNGNGSRDARDVANLRKAILKTLDISELARLAGDINDNSSLDARDVANLRKAILGTYTID